MTVLVKPRVETRTKTTTDIKITSETIESMDFTVFDDIFDGLIPFGDEDDRGGGDESCDSLYEECDRTAKYYIMFADRQGRQDNCRIRGKYNRGMEQKMTRKFLDEISPLPSTY